jgi:glyoxylase-like metal-dependent hydrolase (beta-lactamase superfamily II)
VKYNRRTGLAIFIGLFTGSPIFGNPGDSTRFGEIRLDDRVMVLIHAPWAETMTVVDAGPGLIVVDTWGSLATAKRASARIDSVFHEPVLSVINTHHHWDHTFGNAAFQDAEIVGHRFCAADMRASYGDPATRKTKLEESARLADYTSVRDYIHEVERESSGNGFRLLPPSRLTDECDTLHIGDLTVILYHTPGIHTRGNLTIFIPELGIVFGRREFAGSGTIKLEPGADPSKISRVLENILAVGKPVRYLIPGHGEAIDNPNLYKAIINFNKL